MRKPIQTRTPTRQDKNSAAVRARSSLVADISPLPKSKHAAERRACARDLARFLRSFMPEKFWRPFDPDSLHAIGRIQDAILRHGTFAEAMPRGKGKTTVAEGALLWAVAYGHRRFVVALASDQEKANDILANIQAVVEGQCPRFVEAFPEIAYPVARLEGRNQRAQSQHCAGVPTGLMWKANKLVFPTIKRAKSSGSIVTAKGITAKGVRGLNHEGVRPDFVLLDDPQDDESAASEEQTDKREKVIAGTVMGLAGHDKKISGVMTCTVICKGDLSSRFLDREKHPEWQGYRTKLVDAWATEEKRWGEYDAIWREDVQDGKGLARATEFYRANRAAMDVGARLCSPDLYDKSCEISALQHARNLLLEVGPAAFAAEYQNEPLEEGATVYNLTPAVVLSRTTDRAPGVAPAWSWLRLAATDINPSYGLTWGLAAFGHDQTAAVLGYGVHKMDVPGSATEVERARAIYEALVVHGKALSGLPCRPEAWFIDAGGEAFDVVTRFAAECPRLCGLVAYAATGRGARNYRTTGATVLGTPREQCHMAVDARGRKWVAWNADFWKEVAQRAWTGSPGAPGSCSLPAGRHVEFAEQVCREPLAGKGEVGGRMVWIYHNLPGRHDYGDVMAMLYMGAAFGGIGTGGEVTKPKQVARVAISRPRRY